LIPLGKKSTPPESKALNKILFGCHSVSFEKGKPMEGLSKRNQTKFCGLKSKHLLPIARGANSLRSLLHSQINLATTNRQAHKKKSQTKGKRRDW